ncbi:S24 family peptidase [Joostella sp. CR20]|uniref:S24 family peptidase n=1 Tax=Joostella sp. CR20 TaxID=2804312 RepID=UPI00313F028A
MNAIEIKNNRKKLGLNQTEFGELLGVSLRAVQYWEKSEREMPEATQKLLQSIMNEQSSHNTNVQNVHNTQPDTKPTPYYDIDFTASFLEVENNLQTKPDRYVTHPFFEGCDFIVRASGQSMAKLIRHGDAIGLIRIPNWQDFLPLGEVYAIVTKNGFRMIKIITKGSDKEHYTLISKPSDSKKDEFPPQEIPKNQILHIYKVQASSHLF